MSGKTAEDIEFEEKLAKATFKTTYQDMGTQKSKIEVENGNGINGKFTDHLIYSGMPKYAHLNTTAEKERYVPGSKDWMEKLG